MKYPTLFRAPADPMPPPVKEPPPEGPESPDVIPIREPDPEEPGEIQPHAPTPNVTVTARYANQPRKRPQSGGQSS